MITSSKILQPVNSDPKTLTFIHSFIQLINIITKYVPSIIPGIKEVASYIDGHRIMW